MQVGTWPIDYTLADVTAFRDPELQLACERMAVELLWNWTNRVFGTEGVTLRPTWHASGFQMSTFVGAGPYVRRGWQPVFLRGEWQTLTCGNCNSLACDCDAESVTSLHIPGPVLSVEKITIDGVDLPSSAYRIDSKRRLTRSDGQPWPTTQDLSKPPGQAGTWTIEYTRGLPVPQGGQTAAGTLAVQLGKAAVGARDCSLPQRVQSVSRQGVTVGVMLDTFEDLQQGRTGIWSIDSWIASVTMPRSRSSVRSVDVPRGPSWRT